MSEGPEETIDELQQDLDSITVLLSQLEPAEARERTLQQVQKIRDLLNDVLASVTELEPPCENLETRARSLQIALHLREQEIREVIQTLKDTIIDHMEQTDEEGDDDADWWKNGENPPY